LIKNGKLAPTALQDGAASGIGQLLGNPAGSPAGNAPSQPASDEAVAQPAKGKKRQATNDPIYTPETSPEQALQDFFGNQQ